MKQGRGSERDERKDRTDREARGKVRGTSAKRNLDEAEGSVRDRAKRAIFLTKVKL